MVQDDPKVLDDGGDSRDTQISRKRLAVRFPTVKTSLYLTKYLLDGKLPSMLNALTMACRPSILKKEK